VGKKKRPTITNENSITASFNAPNYPVSNCCPGHTFVAALKPKILDSLSNQLTEALYNNEDTLGIEGSLIAQEGLQLLNGLKEGYRTTVGYNTPDTLAYQLMEYNLFEFSASKTEARLAAMTELLIDKEKRNIRSFDDFKKLADEKTSQFNNEWLLTEYNLSVAVGQNSAAYHRFIAEKDEFPFVEYQTAGDSKVRSQHAKLEGKIFNLNDREAMRLWPPNGYGCRCEMLQTNKRPKNVTSGKQALEQMYDADPKWSKSQFAINRADLKQVFTKEQFYSNIKGLPKKLNKMTFDKYNLPKWDAFKSDLNTLNLDSSITADNVSELFKKDKAGDFMGFKDYFGRKLVLTKSNFDKHTKGFYVNKQEIRHQLFPNIKDILNKPDEVWYNTKDKLDGKFQSRYIKFYKDEIIIIDCEQTGKGLEIQTWYKAKKEDLHLRKGLLIRNKV
jgi:SPP1 gp7 family putative phage head morphogenesis protein